MPNHGIPQEEQSFAAMYFAMSNAAVLELANGIEEIRYAYDHVSGVVEMETGCSLDEEKQYWLKECKKAKLGSYVAEEWSRVRANWKI